MPGDSLFGGVDGDARVVLLLGGGQRDWVGLGRFWRPQGGSDLGVINNTFSQALVVQGAGEVGGLAVGFGIGAGLLSLITLWLCLEITWVMLVMVRYDTLIVLRLRMGRSG